MRTFIQTGTALVLILSFALLLNSGCDAEYTEGPADLLPLPNRVAFEMKFLLDPDKVVDANGNLLPEIGIIFNNALSPYWAAPANNAGMNAPAAQRIVTQVFLDTPNLDFFRAGWINRMRLCTYGGSGSFGAGDMQVTVRRRIPIPSGSNLTEQMVQKAYTQSIMDGSFSFAATQADSIDENVEIDWSYDTAVFTMSRSHTITGYHANFNHGWYGNLDGAKKLFMDNLPVAAMSQYLNITDRKLGIIPHPSATPGLSFVEWYKDNLEKSVLYGPVTIRRWRAQVTMTPAQVKDFFGFEKMTIAATPAPVGQRIRLEIEIMPYFDTYVVELSASGFILWEPVEGIDRVPPAPFTNNSPPAADQQFRSFQMVSHLREHLKQVCIDAGVLIPESGFKTSIVLENMRQDTGHKFAD